MTRTRTAALLITFALALAGCWSLTWQDFLAPDGAFRILMPGLPELRVQTIQTPYGEQEQQIYEVDRGPQAYMIGFTVLPPDVLAEYPADVLLDDAVGRGVAAVNGTVQRFEQTTFAGHPARRVVIEVADGDGVIHARFVMVDDRLYQIAAIVATRIIDEEAVERFLDSFTPIPRGNGG